MSYSKYKEDFFHKDCLKCLKCKRNLVGRFFMLKDVL